MSLYCRLLSSNIVQLDMSIVGLTLDQSTIASGEVSVESEFVFCDPLAQLDQKVYDGKDNRRSSQNTDTGSSN